MRRAPLQGDVLPPRALGPISRTDIVRYAGASGDFNPIHHDQEFAESAGYPSVFSMGMLQAGLLATYATDMFGPANVRRFTVRFKEQVWPGDELICSGVVSGVVSDSEGALVEVQLSCRRHAGGEAIAGTAVFRLDSAR